MDIENKNKPKWTSPLLCWDIVAMYLAEMTALGGSQSDLLNLLEYQKRFSWHTDLSYILNSSYDALVLTDSSIKIEWVNKGFYHMTGYVKNEAIGKKPNFLQGKNTSEVSKRRVREQLLGVNTFSETLINYRKSGEEYACYVEIHPLFTKENRLSHFLALETELK